MKNFGCEWVLQCSECIEKGKQTRFKEHGDRNWSNHEKASKTFKQHIAEDSKFLNNIQKKIEETNVRNGHPKNWTNREKAKQTRLENHDGVYWTQEMEEKKSATKEQKRQENPNYDKEIRQRIEATNLKLAITEDDCHSALRQRCPSFPR